MSEKDKEKKKVQKELRKKRTFYTPNTKLYLILSALLTLVVAIIFLILCLNINSNPHVVICSALISILGGALASVVTAWLIDVFQCKSRNKSLNKQGDNCISYLRSSLDDLFQSLADNCYSESDDNQSKRWDYWIDCLNKKNFYRDESDFYDRMLATYVSLNMAISETERLCNGELRQYTESVYSDLMEFQLLSTACKQLNDVIFNNENENLSFIKYKINDVLLTIVAFWDIEKKTYIPHKKVSQSKGDVLCEA